MVFSIKDNSSKEKGSLGNSPQIRPKVLIADILNSILSALQALHKILIKFGHPWSLIEITESELTKLQAA